MARGRARDTQGQGPDDTAVSRAVDAVVLSLFPPAVSVVRLLIFACGIKINLVV
jgi:hypothetical protein